MSKFEAVSTGNIATTPLKAPNTIMSPTEKAAFAAPVDQVEDLASTSDSFVSAKPDDKLWEVLEDKRWRDDRLGENITNRFQRITSRTKVPGGHLYLVSTYVMTYVRGVSDNSVSETMQFVPDSAREAKPKAK